MLSVSQAVIVSGVMLVLAVAYSAANIASAIRSLRRPRSSHANVPWRVSDYDADSPRMQQWRRTHAANENPPPPPGARPIPTPPPPPPVR